MHSSRKSFISLIVLLLVITTVTSWSVQFDPKNITVHMHRNQTAWLTISGLKENVHSAAEIHVRSDNPKLLRIDHKITNEQLAPNIVNWNGTISFDAIFLGSPNIYVEVVYANGTQEIAEQQMPVIVIREERIIDHIFVGSVIVLVSILYINFGAALNVQKVRGHLVKPIGPAIGLSCQFIIMPLVICIIIEHKSKLFLL